MTTESSNFAKEEVKPIPPKEDLTTRIANKESMSSFDDFYDTMTNYNTEFFQDLTTDDILEIVRDMLTDPQIQSDLEVLEGFIESEDYEVKVPEDPDAKAVEMQDYVNSMITAKGGKFLAMTSAFLNSLKYGKSVFEVVWGAPINNDGKWVMDELIFLDPERYTFSNDSELIDTQAGNEPVDTEFKYIVVTHDPREGNLNGFSELLKVYWPWIFKKACLKSAVLYAKKSIIPSLAAMVNASQDEAKTQLRVDAVSQALAGLQNSSGIALANVEDVKQFNATAKGDDIINLIEMFDRMISKGLIGTPKLTNETKYSNSESRETQEKIPKRKGQKIAKTELQPAINQVIIWALRLNFNVQPGQMVPYFEYTYKYNPTLEEVNAAIDRKIPIDLPWYYDKFNIKVPESDEDSFVVEDPEPQQQGFSSTDSFFLRSKAGRTLAKQLKNRSETQRNNSQTT